jgi:hypothetical protein
MSRFYSSIQGERGEATRRGHRHIRASAQSYTGSVIVQMYIDEEDRDCVRIDVDEGSTKHGGSLHLYEGPIETLLEQPARQTLMQAFINDTLTS